MKLNITLVTKGIIEVDIEEMCDDLGIEEQEWQDKSEADKLEAIKDYLGEDMDATVNDTEGAPEITELTLA